MPLAWIRLVCDLEPAEAAGAVAAYWSQVEADTASRREPVTFLTGYLSRKDPAMPESCETLGIR
jgi:hypothetical protein